MLRMRIHTHGCYPITQKDPLGKSDHIVMEYEYIYSIRIPESKNSKYLYEKGDYQSFNEELMCSYRLGSIVHKYVN